MTQTTARIKKTGKNFEIFKALILKYSRFRKIDIILKQIDSFNEQELDIIADEIKKDPIKDIVKLDVEKVTSRIKWFDTLKNLRKLDQ